MDTSSLPKYFGPIAQTNFPHLTIGLCTIGLLITAWFMVYEVTATKYSRNLFKELTIASAAALFLGFGSTFLLLWVGIYI